MKRQYNIIPNYYSPMCGDWGNGLIESCESSHGIIYRGCNFHCGFCNNSFHKKDLYKEYSTDEFIANLISLMPRSKHFKFSGGEQTINPFLKEDLRIVKELGGYTFLDSNGSKPQVIRELINERLVDVLGILLKGLTADEAANVSHVRKTELCWENVLETIKFASQTPDLRVIITYVFFNSADIHTLEKFAGIIEDYDNVILKLNNLLHDKHHMDDLKPVDHSYFMNFIHTFIDNNPLWKRRTIIVNTEKAITNYDDIIFM